LHQRTEKELEQSLSRNEVLEQLISKAERDVREDDRWISNLRGTLIRRDETIAAKEHELERMQRRMEEQSTVLMRQISQKDRDIHALWGEIDRLRPSLSSDTNKMMDIGGPKIKVELPTPKEVQDLKRSFEDGGSGDEEVIKKIKKEPED
jgi:predicted RNase H-like nuclease (RuvC/YqgF family)